MIIASAQDNGYEGYDNTRNTTNAPWIAAFGDGISNWAGDRGHQSVQFKSVDVRNGQGIWATNNTSNGGANTAIDRGE